MFWFELKVQVNEEMASNLRILLAFPIIMLSIGIIMIIIGLGLIGTIAFLYLKKKRRVPPAVCIRFINLFKFLTAERRISLERIFIATDTHFIGYYARKSSRRIA